MSSDLGYDEDARWLQSDGSIIGKIRRTPDPQGIRLSLDMPFGEPVVAIVAKLNASSMTQYCDLVRGTYNERKAEQAAKAQRASREAEERKGQDATGREETVQTVQASVVVDPMDPESISRRLLEIAKRVGALSAEVKALDAEGNVLYKILEVLENAQTDDEETNGCLQTTTPSPNKGEGAESGVDIPSCEAQLYSPGEASAVESDTRLESLPDAEAQSSEDGSLKNEADVNTSS